MELDDVNLLDDARPTTALEYPVRIKSVPHSEPSNLACIPRQKRLPPPPQDLFVQKSHGAPTPPKFIQVIINPFSGNQKATKVWRNEVKPIFEKAGITFEVIETDRPRHATEIAIAYDKEKFDAFVLIGGDGTFSEAVTGLMRRDDQAQGVVVGFIPGGTGNSLMASFGTSNAKIAAQSILDGNKSFIDVGKCTFGPDSEVSYLVNVLGWGLGVDANITAEKLRFFGPARYDMGAMWEILKGKKRKVDLDIDGEKISGDIACILLQNNPHSGSNLRVAPNALIDDGLLDVLLLPNKGRMGILNMFSDLKNQGSHIFDDELPYLQFKRMSITCPKAEIVNIDGENCAMTPIVIEAIPRAICCFVSSSSLLG